MCSLPSARLDGSALPVCELVPCSTVLQSWRVVRMRRWFCAHVTEVWLGV